MNYPTLEQVKNADRYDICKWHRFLPSPSNDEQLIISNNIHQKFTEMGGFTPELSKQIGWTKNS